MKRTEKETVIEEVTAIFQKAKSVFITDYAGLTVEKVSVFRRKCREASVGYLVVKNTLARMGVEKAGWKDLGPYFKGPSAIAYSFTDPVAPARVIHEFLKENEKPKIKGSIFEGQFIGPERVKEIATLPSRDELIAKLMGQLNAPIQGVVCGLNGLLTKFVRTVDAIREAKERAS